MSYVIGSFNLCSFGQTAITKKNLEKIASIIRDAHFDVVAIQEVFSEGKAIDWLVKYHLPGWECICSESPPERQPNQSGSRNEEYAFLWNTKRFEKAYYESSTGRKVFEPRILETSRYGRAAAENGSLLPFTRSPFFIRLQPFDDPGVELRLVNAHLFFGSNNKIDIQQRLREYDALVQRVYPDVEQRRYGNQLQSITIAMGDYNLNLPGSGGSARAAVIPNPEYVYQDSRGRKVFTILTAQTQRSTLRTPQDPDPEHPELSVQASDHLANNYDHFTYSVDGRFTVRCCETYDVAGNNPQEYRGTISDHLPILLEIDLKARG